MARAPGESDKATGMAIDVSRSARPGVPRERHPAADPGAHGRSPEPQRLEIAAPGHRGARREAAVFGTPEPTRGVSGAMRRAAYRLPEHRAGRWMLLLAGDRLDVLEHRLARALWLVPAAAGLVLGYTLTRRALARL